MKPSPRHIFIAYHRKKQKRKQETPARKKTRTVLYLPVNTHPQHENNRRPRQDAHQSNSNLDPPPATHTLKTTCMCNHEKPPRRVSHPWRSNTYTSHRTAATRPGNKHMNPQDDTRTQLRVQQNTAHKRQPQNHVADALDPEGRTQRLLLFSWDSGAFRALANWTTFLDRAYSPGELRHTTWMQHVISCTPQRSQTPNEFYTSPEAKAPLFPPPPPPAPISHAVEHEVYVPSPCLSPGL